MNIGDSTDIPISRQEAGFDRACETAYRIALGYFGIDEDGHSSRVKGWFRSCCWIEVTFVSYTRSGSEHNYQFKATACRAEG